MKTITLRLVESKDIFTGRPQFGFIRDSDLKHEAGHWSTVADAYKWAEETKLNDTKYVVIVGHSYNDINRANAKHGGLRFARQRK